MWIPSILITPQILESKTLVSSGAHVHIIWFTHGTKITPCLTWYLVWFSLFCLHGFGLHAEQDSIRCITLNRLIGWFGDICLMWASTNTKRRILWTIKVVFSSAKRASMQGLWDWNLVPLCPHKFLHSFKPKYWLMCQSEESPEDFQTGPVLGCLQMWWITW